MTKEEYLLLIKKPEVPIELWFAYYREMGGIIEEINEFAQIFSTILWNQSEILGSDGVMKKVTPQSAFNRLHSYYHKKFGL